MDDSATPPGSAGPGAFAAPEPSVAVREAQDELYRLLHAGELELPVLPGVVAEIMTRAGQEDADPKVLAETLLTTKSSLNPPRSPFKRSPFAQKFR